MDRAAHGRHRDAADDGVGIETEPVFSPDGSTIAFTGDYDGNTDVFTIPATGGVPFRVTYHPAADFAVAWTADGKNIVFRSTRISQSRYTQLLRRCRRRAALRRCCRCRWHTKESSRRMAKQMAYSPLPPAYGFDYMSYVSWGNYHGGRASTIWITTLPELESVEIPHEMASDFAPVYAGGKVYFLSARKGKATIYKYDPASKAVTQALANDGPDIRSLHGEGDTLVYDRLGEIYLYDTKSGNEQTGADRDRRRHAGGAGTRSRASETNWKTHRFRRRVCARWSRRMATSSRCRRSTGPRAISPIRRE